MPDEPHASIPFPPIEAELVRELPEGEGCQIAGETMFPPRAPFFLSRSAEVVDDSSVRLIVTSLRDGGAGKAGTSVGGAA